MLATLLVVFGILVLMPSSYVCAGGYVWNPGFEYGEGEDPSAWNLTGDAARVDTDPIYSGNWSARIAGNNDTLTQWVYLGNGTTLLPIPITYNAWGWICVSGNATGVIALDFWAGVVGNGTSLTPATMMWANNTGGEYVQRTSVLQSPPGATHLRIRLLGTGWDGGAEVRFDEIGLYVVTGYCFIATAVYGTETAAELDTLRDFRDQVLLKNALGSRFVAAYYRLSPPIADFIARNDFLRAVVREALLDPMVHLLQWSQGLWKV